MKNVAVKGKLSLPPNFISHHMETAISAVLAKDTLKEMIILFNSSETSRQNRNVNLSNGEVRGHSIRGDDSLFLFQNNLTLLHIASERQCVHSQQVSLLLPWLNVAGRTGTNAQGSRMTFPHGTEWFNFFSFANSMVFFFFCKMTYCCVDCASYNKNIHLNVGVILDFITQGEPFHQHLTQEYRGKTESRTHRIQRAKPYMFVCLFRVPGTGGKVHTRTNLVYHL